MQAAIVKIEKIDYVTIDGRKLKVQCDDGVFRFEFQYEDDAKKAIERIDLCICKSIKSIIVEAPLVEK